MATTKTISAALKLVDTKKENLRKAFEDLQSNSSSLSSFNLTWSELDSYFTSIQSSLEHKFKILQSQQEKQQQSQPSDSKPPQIQSQSQSQIPNPPDSQLLIAEDSPDFSLVLARPELKSFCEKMDGLGLRKYIVERPKERNTIRDELRDALRCAPDAAAIVLGAMEGFYDPNSKGDKNIELSAIRKSCVVLLEELRRAKVEIGGEIKEKARNLAEEWKGKVAQVSNGPSSDGEDNPLEVLAFFHLLVAYGVADGFNVEELIDYAVVVARFRESVEVFRLLGFGPKISEIIQKLVAKGKQLVAVKLIVEFELSDKFPLAPLLEEYVEESKKVAKKALKDKTISLKSQREALKKEANAYKSVMRTIEDYKLESVFPKGKILKHIEKVEQLKSKTQQSNPQKLSGSKRQRNAVPPRPVPSPVSVAATSSGGPAFQHSHPQPAGLLPEHRHPYLGSSAGPYGLVGSTPAVAPYAGSSAAGLYGSTGAPGNLVSSQTLVYPSESHMATGYYDRPVAYGSYDFQPQYHQPYYPQ